MNESDETPNKRKKTNEEPDVLFIDLDDIRSSDDDENEYDEELTVNTEQVEVPERVGQKRRPFTVQNNEGASRRSRNTRLGKVLTV